MTVLRSNVDDPPADADDRPAGAAHSARVLRRLTLWVAVPLIVVACVAALGSRLTEPRHTSSPAPTPAAASTDVPVAVATAVATSAVAAPETSVRYPANLIRNFMNACTSRGGTAPVCTCVIEHIQAAYTLQEYTTIESRLQAGDQPPAEMGRIVSACAAPPH